MPQPTLIDRLLRAYAQTGHLPQISGGDGSDEGQNGSAANDQQDSGDKGKDDTGKVTFTAEQQAELNRIVAREAKAARDKAQQAERDRIKAEQDEAEKERQRKADEERGEFGKVKDGLIAERDQFKTEAERIKGEYEAVAGLFTKQYEAAIRDIPDDLKLFQPDDGASILDRVAFLDKLQTALKKRGTETTRGNGPNPKPNGNGMDKEAAERARLATRPNF